MQLIDTHAHIYLPDFDADRDILINKAEESAVIKIIMPAIDASTHRRMLEVEELNSNCIAMMGLHPCSVKEDNKEELAIIHKYLVQRNFIAIGEIGLDFYWDTTFTQQQYAAFEKQIQWALEMSLPIVIHSRNATDECIEVIKKYPSVRGIFHCFSGTVEQAQVIIDLQFYLGIGGVVTYKNAGLDKVIAHIGIDRLVLETDAPYLAPVPYRGKRNESSYIKIIAEKIASLTNHTIEEVANVTTANAKNLFKLG